MKTRKMQNSCKNPDLVLVPTSGRGWLRVFSSKASHRAFEGCVPAIPGPEVPTSSPRSPTHRELADYRLGLPVRLAFHPTLS